MQVMQYAVPLPADYDMKIIRKRVASKGPALDTLPDLGIKAYVIRERGVDGSQVNEYAPFYLWTSVNGMNNFLWGGGFAGFCAAFGRPVVRQWTGLAFAQGPARSAMPRAASRRTERIPADADPETVIDAAIASTRQDANSPEVCCTALAVDTRDWELVRFTLWWEQAPESAGTRYEVLHLSRPHFDDLPVGRLW